jgi:hypothetical protein
MNVVIADLTDGTSDYYPSDMPKYLPPPRNNSFQRSLDWKFIGHINYSSGYNHYWWEAILNGKTLICFLVYNELDFESEPISPAELHRQQRKWSVKYQTEQMSKRRLA